MFMCRLGGATACYPRPIGMRGSGSRVLCRGVSQPLSAHWQHLVLMLCANVAHCCTYQRAVRRGGSARRCARTSAAPDRTETDPARIVKYNQMTRGPRKLPQPYGCVRHFTSFIYTFQHANKALPHALFPLAERTITRLNRKCTRFYGCRCGPELN